MSFSRRAVLVGGLAVPAGAAAALGTAAAAAQAERDALAEALAEIARTAAAAHSAGPAQAVFCGWAAALHDRQVALLARVTRITPPTVSDAVSLPADDAAYARLAGLERDLVATLRASAVGVEHAQLVALLAGIGAAAAQQATILEGLA